MVVASSPPSVSSSLPGYGGYRPVYERLHLTEAIGERERPGKFFARPTAAAQWLKDRSSASPPTSLTAATATAAASFASTRRSPSTSALRSVYSSAFSESARRSLSAPAGDSPDALLSSSASAPQSSSLPPLACNLLRSTAAYGLATRYAVDFEPPLGRVVASHRRSVGDTQESSAPLPSLSAMCSTQDLLLGTSKVSDGLRLIGYEGHQPRAEGRLSLQ